MLVAAAAVVGLPVVVLGILITVITGATVVAVSGLVVGVALAALTTVPAWQHAEERSLALVFPRDADPVDHARLFNLVEGLCTGAGVVRPRLFVVQSPSLNAMTLGRDARHGCLVVTEGLLASLTRIELEAVVAHELVHLAAGDTAGPTVALALFGSSGAARLSRVAAAVVARQVPPDRESLADLAAVALTRYPPGLASALERVRGDASAWVDAPLVTAALWLRSPDGPGDLDERVEALRAL